MRKSLHFVLFFLIACGSSEPAPVQVIGGAEDLAPLTGEWTGTYDSRVSGRTGSITFHLTENPKGAHGDVLLVPRHEFVRNEDHHQLRPSFSSSAILSIEFVRVAAGEISGKIAPYPDPDHAGRLLETHFAGHVEGEWIEGTFVTYSDHGNSPLRGTWRVHRKRS